MTTSTATERRPRLRQGTRLIALLGVALLLSGLAAMPVLAAYLLANAAPRPSKRLYDRRAELLSNIQEAYLANLDHATSNVNAADAGGSAENAENLHTGDLSGRA